MILHTPARRLLNVPGIFSGLSEPVLKAKATRSTNRDPSLRLFISRREPGLSKLNAAGIFLSPMSLGVNCSSVVIGDFNADGRLDLVATSPNAGNVSILLQSTIGSGNFLSPLTVVAGFQPIDVAVADLNGDGLPDLAIANSGTPGNAGSVSILFQNPGGWEPFFLQ